MEFDFLTLYETDIVLGRDHKYHSYTFSGVPLANELYVSRDGGKPLLMCWSDIVKLIEFSLGFRLCEPSHSNEH